MPVSGEQITPYLKLVRPLGEGGMGRLWVAEHQKLEIEVAVKLLNPTLAQDEQWLARFREEAHAIAKIDSVHVVRVFDYGTTPSNEPFIVMELLRGEDLLRHIERTNCLSLDEILQIVSQTCKALSRAHAVGIVHRDLKPENIFLTREGEELFVKLLDFGIAKHQRPQRTGLTQADAIFGTPPYMSPEQILSAGSVDHRADLWALSVVIFEMLTGSCPFAGPTPAAVCLKIQAGEFARPSEVRPSLPKSADAWFKRAFNPDIQMRFASAEELFREFRQALQLPDSSLYRVTTPAASLVPGWSTPTSATDVEIGLLRPRLRRSTLLGVAAVIAAGLIAGFVAVRSAGWSSGEPKTALAPSATSLVGLRSSTARVPADQPRDVGNGSTDSAPTASPPNTAERDAPAPPTVRSEPRARPGQRAVKANDASPAPATNAPSPPSAGQKPIKDRGF